MGHLGADSQVSLEATGKYWQLWPASQPHAQRHVKDSHPQYPPTLKNCVDFATMFSLFGSGNSVPNCYKVMFAHHARILKPTGLATLRSTVTVSLANVGGDGYYMSTSAVIWPHELFASLWSHHPDKFTKYVLGSVDGVKEFWRKMPARPQMQQRSNWRTPLCATGSTWGWCECCKHSREGCKDSGCHLLD